MIRAKKYILLSFLLVFLIGFLMSSGFYSIVAETGSMIMPKLEACVNSQINRFLLYPDAKHCFLLESNHYWQFVNGGLTFGMILTMLRNAVLNFMFQPTFLCIFTPQALLNYILMPFFIYGSVKYFKKVPLMILFFAALGIYIGLSDSFAEALIRHRMSCELIYLLIGLAGLTSLITKNSY